MDSPPTALKSPRARLSPFIALQNRDFRLLWFGLLISVAGSQMQAVAINWHLYELTHSALALGLLGLARLVPIVAFSLVGSIVFQIATIVGPGLAGILIGAYGVGLIYWINAASFLAVLGALVLMRTRSVPLAEGEGEVGVGALREGLRFVLNSRMIFSTMLL